MLVVDVGVLPRGGHRGDVLPEGGKEGEFGRPLFEKDIRNRSTSTIGCKASAAGRASKPRGTRNSSAASTTKKKPQRGSVYSKAMADATHTTKTRIDDGLLRELAAAHGIGTTFRGWDGVERPVSGSTLRGVLTALGVPADGPAELQAPAGRPGWRPGGASCRRWSWHGKGRKSTSLSMRPTAAGQRLDHRRGRQQARSGPAGTATSRPTSTASSPAARLSPSRPPGPGLAHPVCRRGRRIAECPLMVTPNGWVPPAAGRTAELGPDGAALFRAVLTLLGDRRLRRPR